MSDTPTIAQMNYAIAKFMGFEKVTVGYAGTEEETEWQNNHIEWMHKVGIQLVGDYIVNVKENLWYGWEGVSYHTSWDWLIPVIKKIKDHKQSCIRLTLNGISESVYPYVEAMQPMNRALIKADLKGVYDGVIKFIAWYNQNKNQ